MGQGLGSVSTWLGKAAWLEGGLLGVRILEVRPWVGGCGPGLVPTQSEEVSEGGVER